MSADRDRLLEIVRAEALLRGSFTLSSGATSDTYLDCRRATLHPEGSFLCASLLLDWLEREALHPDCVAEVVGRWRSGVSKVQFALSTVDAAGCFVGNVFPNFPPGLTYDDILEEALATGLYPCPPTSGNAYARWWNRPGAIIRMPGIIMLVPGSTSLRGLLTMIQQQDMGAGQDALLAVTTILLSLIAGLLFGNLLLPPGRNL